MDKIHYQMNEVMPRQMYPFKKFRKKTLQERVAPRTFTTLEVLQIQPEWPACILNRIILNRDLVNMSPV